MLLLPVLGVPVPVPGLPLLLLVAGIPLELNPVAAPPSLQSCSRRR